MTRCVLFLLAMCFAEGLAYARPPKDFKEAATVTARFEPAEAKPGQTVTLKITIKPKEGLWTYPTIQEEKAAEGQTNKFRFPNDTPLIFVGEVKDPDGGPTKEDKSTPDGAKRMRYFPFEVTFERKAVVAPDAVPGKITVALAEKVGSRTVNSRIQVCDDEGCIYSSLLPPYTADLTILDGKVDVDAKYVEAVKAELAKRGKQTPSNEPKEPKKEIVEGPKKDPSPIVQEKPIPTERDHGVELAAIRKELPKTPPAAEGMSSESSGLATLLVTAAFWGFVSLITPCVFPMIPITVSIFLKRGGESSATTIKLASIYCITIIVVLGISALTLLSVFRELSVNPYMNIALGLLFVFFALSLFGMYDIVLPNFLTRFTSSREGSGVLGTIFMALTFTIVSFTCVAPFLGGFSGMAASGQYSTFQLMLAGITFSTAFAAPFFVLALFPNLLKSLPKSGSWMNSVKVIMGFLELAAALKFFRTAELRLLPVPAYFTYDLVLGMWVVLGILCGLYLLNIYRLPHDEPQEHIGVPRLMLAVIFITLGIYLLPGLFQHGSSGERQRPAGSVFAWVDAFLLPEPGPGDLPWTTDLKTAIEQAREDRKNGKPAYLFLDFTGVTCTNCKYNEYNIFPMANIKPLLRKYRLVQMYTDEVPVHFYSDKPDDLIRIADAVENLRFQKEVFGTEQLPLYVILEPREDKIEVVGVYSEGKINNVDAFAQFLKKPFPER